MNTIKEMVGKNKVVTFSHYQNGELWYNTECGFSFPVPTTDTGTGLFAKIDKAILFMRWIRKHLEFIENSKQLR
jgi:hypothetical protein